MSFYRVRVRLSVDSHPPMPRMPVAMKSPACREGVGRTASAQRIGAEPPAVSGGIDLSAVNPRQEIVKARVQQRGSAACPASGSLLQERGGGGDAGRRWGGRKGRWGIERCSSEIYMFIAAYVAVYSLRRARRTLLSPHECNPPIACPYVVCPHNGRRVTF